MSSYDATVSRSSRIESIIFASFFSSPLEVTWSRPRFHTWNRVSFENATRAPRDENHGPRAWFPFFHRFWHTGNRQVSVVNTFCAGPAVNDHFLSWANFPARVCATGIQCYTTGWNAIVWEDDTQRGRDSTSTFTAGCSFRSVKRVVLRGGRTGQSREKKKTARCLMQCQKQWGYLWRDEKISVDLRQPYIMTLSCKNKRAEKSPMKTKRTIRRLWQSMDNDVYNATLSNVPAGWQHSRIFCYLACSFIELCSE